MVDPRAPRRPAHPRSRGENRTTARFAPSALGSSPLTRGKRHQRCLRGSPQGLIPAHAGKTVSEPPSMATARAHPRSRGENFERYASKGSERGSSPLTRGKLSHQSQVALQIRLIPAHAGKTSRPSAPPSAWSAHPRSRGENGTMPGSTRMVSGSSPLTRGKRFSRTASRNIDGLIPAHAGKTCREDTMRSISWAHPRSRGENYGVEIELFDGYGSSPLTRGKHFPTCAFTAQIDQILETLELAVSSGSYSVWVACATDAPQDQVRSIGLVLPSSRGAS